MDRRFLLVRNERKRKFISDRCVECTSMTGRQTPKPSSSQAEFTDIKVVTASQKRVGTVLQDSGRLTWKISLFLWHNALECGVYSLFLRLV